MITFDFNGDYGYELSQYDIDRILNAKTDEEKADICLSITTNTRTERNRISKDAGYIVTFLSDNSYVMFRAYVQN